MREELARLVGKRRRFRATLGPTMAEYGPGWRLLFDVSDPDTGRYLCDHVRVRVRVRAMSAPGQEIRTGDRIEFTAKIERYRRRNGTTDYDLRELRSLRRSAVGNFANRADTP